MKLSDKEKAWAKAALSRAVRTMAQIMLTYITLGAVTKDINWKEMVSAGVVAFCYSILTSVVKRPPESKDIPDGGTIVLSNPEYDGDIGHISFKLNHGIDDLEDGSKVTFLCVDNMDDKFKEIFRGNSASSSMEFDDNEKE